MFTSSLIMTILRELLPFLKEALLEGQSFRVWLKSNWMTFAWLINMFVLTLVISMLSDAVTVAVRKESEATRQLAAIRAPLQEMVGKYKQLRDENTALRARIQVLETEATADDQTILQYEEWMGDCGVNFEDRGQCRVVRQSTPRAKPRPTQNKPKTPPIDLPEQSTPTEPKQRPGFFNRLREAFRRDTAEEQKEEP